MRLVALLAQALGVGTPVSSCRAEGWRGVRDRPLLEAMAEHSPPFLVLVTADRLLWPDHRRLLARLGIGVVLMHRPSTALARVPAILDAIRRVLPGRLEQVTTA